MTNQMTITVKFPACLTIALAGCGEAYIDWGDESANDIFTLSSDFTEYSHKYEKISGCVITIAGDNVTGLRCPEIEVIECVETDTDDPYVYSVYKNTVTALDVSRNTQLQKLFCNNNRLTALDVSHNIALTVLSCFNNKLTSLDVSHNRALINLDCSHNLIPFIDLSHNTLLEIANIESSENLILNEKMQSLIVQATSETPYVCFDARKWILEMTGRGTAKNSTPFFLKLFDWLNYWHQNYQQINSAIVVNFRFDYYNDDFSKWLYFYIFRKLNNLHGKGVEITVNWYYDQDDEEMYEQGLDFQSGTTYPFNFIEKTDALQK